jgi:ADP-heptose:LPS heptosyltransferase
VGTAADRELGDSLAAGHPSVSNLAGRTSLRETFSLVHAADAVVCSASMLMHVAAAFEKRTAVVLGPNYPSATEEATLWNCNPGTAILGKEPGRDRIATPDEVLAWVGSA